MALRMMSGLPARISQVLQDFLPAELDLIDAEEADGITTPDIAAGNYFQWDRQVIPEFPACTIRTVSSTPIDEFGGIGVKPDGFGQRLIARHRIDVMLHATSKTSDGDPLVLQKLMHRYITGAFRVLCVMKEALQTSGDPTRFVEMVEWPEPATYGPEEAQEDGSVARTATLPISVRRREARS